MSLESSFTFLFQTLHLFGLLLWIGPSLGGYFMLLSAQRTADPKLIRWVRVRWQTILVVEHLGLLLTLVAGLARAWSLGWLADPPTWLVLKLLLIGLVVIPLELVDIFVAHFWVQPALARGDPDLDRRFEVQDRLAAYTALPLALVLVAIVALVVGKPWW